MLRKLAVHLHFSLCLLTLICSNPERGPNEGGSAGTQMLGSWSSCALLCLTQTKQQFACRTVAVWPLVSA